jgi:hypothetical protein
MLYYENLGQDIKNKKKKEEYIMWEYGCLMHIKNDEQDEWIFVVGTKEVVQEEGNLLTILNSLGAVGWELIIVDPMVGWLFKRSSKT